MYTPGSRLAASGTNQAVRFELGSFDLRVYDLSPTCGTYNPLAVWGAH